MREATTAEAGEQIVNGRLIGDCQARRRPHRREWSGRRTFSLSPSTVDGPNDDFTRARRVDPTLMTVARLSVAAYWQVEIVERAHPVVTRKSPAVRARAARRR
jgi:hypothetical protein